MSMKSVHTVTCPKCGKSQQVERWDSVNDYNREEFSHILDKSIFCYTYQFCRKTVFDPQPLLFHRMSLNDIMIGYKVPVMKQSNIFPTSPLLVALKSCCPDGMSDIAECYDEVEPFIERVSEFVTS